VRRTRQRGLNQILARLRPVFEVAYRHITQASRIALAGCRLIHYPVSDQSRCAVQLTESQDSSDIVEGDAHGVRGLRIECMGKRQFRKIKHDTPPILDTIAVVHGQEILAFLSGVVKWEPTATGQRAGLRGSPTEASAHPGALLVPRIVIRAANAELNQERATVRRHRLPEQGRDLRSAVQGLGWPSR
jgi:hypothetical protein